MLELALLSCVYEFQEFGDLLGLTDDFSLTLPVLKQLYNLLRIASGILFPQFITIMIDGSTFTQYYTLIHLHSCSSTYSVNAVHVNCSRSHASEDLPSSEVLKSTSCHLYDYLAQTSCSAKLCHIYATSLCYI